MPREHSPPLINHSFVLSALKEGKRLEGRGPLDMRDIQLEFGEELGGVECRWGKTRVLAQVQATIVKPRDDRPYEGFLLISSEIGSMASAAFENGRSSDEEVMITRLLEKAIRRSEAVDREALCIVAGEKVWQIRLTIHFFSDDGNLLDCACMAGMAALLHFRRGEVETGSGGDGDIRVFGLEERAPVPLAIHHVPLCITFAYFENSLLVIDPTHEESLLSTGTLTVSLNAQRELCVLSKAGGTPLGVDDVMRVVRVAEAKVKELVVKMEGWVAEDLGKRVMEVR